MRIPFAQIDAFADAPFNGNPAAVMLLEAWLDDDVLQAIAQENNLSETAFLVPDASGASDYELRWHTPWAEVALCGHATLASGAWVLGREPERTRVRFRTRRSGVLEVTREAAGYAVALPVLPLSSRSQSEIVSALGIVSPPRATLWNDTGYALIVVDDAAIVHGLSPDFAALEACERSVVIVTARGIDTDIVSRVFTPAFGIPEDPVTGSAHAAMVPWWARELGRGTMTAFQASKRGGRLSCRLDGDRVILSGGCITVIEGSFAF